MSDMPKEIWAYKEDSKIATGLHRTDFLWREKNPDGDKDMVKYTRSDLTGLQCFYDYAGDLPKQFIAIYSDGSGANLFWEHVKGKYQSEGIDQFEGCVGKDWFIDAGYLWFIALPDDFKVCGEDR